MGKSKTMLSGKKTYIMGVLAIVSVGLQIFDVIDYETMITLLGIFLAGEGMALRNSIK